MTNIDEQEQLSAMIDGEVTAEEASRLLNSLRNDPQARVKWHRYHRIRDSLQGYQGISDSAYEDRLSASIMARLAVDPGNASTAEIAGVHGREAEIHHLSNRRRSAEEPNGTNKAADFRVWATGLAMAATVAAVVVFGLRFSELNKTPAVIEVDLADAVDWDEKIRQRDLRWTRSGEQVVSGNQQKLNALLVKHGEFVAVSGMNGLSGYARFVSFDDRVQ